jgi:transposase
VVLHYLPTYSPDCNPVERVWWRLHEAVTRNHRCRTMDELLDLTFDWFASRTHFRVRSPGFAVSQVAEPCPRPARTGPPA